MLIGTENLTEPRTGGNVYSSIASEMRSRIISGEWVSGQQITPEKTLAKEFNVCHSTVKKSLKELEREGLLWSRRGKGRFVVDPRARRKTRTVGIVLFDQKHLASPVTSRRFAGVQDVLGEAGYHLKVTAMNTPAILVKPNSSASLIAMVDPSSIDGALIFAQRADHYHVECLARHIPVVWLDHRTSNPMLRGVKDDYVGGAYSAVEHLLKLGHRNIAIMTAQETFSVADDQYEGAQLAMRKIVFTGSGKLHTLCGESGFTIESGRQLARRFLDLPIRPTAVICGSDEIAIGAFEVLRNAGLGVPDDISMIAWNDTLTAEQIPMPMTTVRIDFRQAAIRGARMLLRLMEHRDEHVEGEDEQLQAELIIRESTASPREERREACIDV